METTYYQSCLKETLAKRCEKNARYSIRAFAKALKVDAGALSRILAGKQIPSFKLAQQILDRLDLSPRETQDFLTSILDVQKQRGLKRVSPYFKNDKWIQQDLSIDLYRVIADWYHVAILELTATENFNGTPQWIASQLNISETEAKLAVERLLGLGLLTYEDKKLKKTHTQLTTTDKAITTPALKKNQKQFLEKALESLENDPIEERSITSMTMAIDPVQLPQAKKMIQEFNRTLCQFLEKGKRKRVYNLGVSLHPLQKK